jgi:hypothetical protein
MINNYTKNQATLLIGGSITTTPTSMVFGIGSSTVAVTDTTLTTGSFALVLTSKTYPSFNKITFQADANSVQMSGLQLREFGIISGLNATGSIYDRTVIPALTFDGTNEIQIQTTWEVF